MMEGALMVTEKHWRQMKIDIDGYNESVKTTRTILKKLGTIEGKQQGMRLLWKLWGKVFWEFL